MESPGQYIKREREHRGFTLVQIHEAIRVPMKLLTALEADDFDSLPHPTFVKGFIRAYSRHLGIDEDDAVLRYELFLKEKTDKAPPDEQESERSTLTIKPAEPSGSRNVIIFVAIGVMVIIVFYIGTTLRGRKQSPPPASVSEVPAAVEPSPMKPAPMEPATDERPPAPVARPANEAVPTVAPPPAAGGAPAAPAVAGKHTLAIEALEEVWVEVTIDESAPFDVTLQQGERIVWKAAEKFFLVIGNAGGVELVFDGKLLASPGEPGKVKRITLPGWKPAPAKKTRDRTPKPPATAPKPAEDGASAVDAAPAE